MCVFKTFGDFLIFFYAQLSRKLSVSTISAGVIIMPNGLVTT
jgi:hypothetical protein